MAFDGTLKFDTAIDKAGFKTGVDGLGSLAEKGLAGIGALAKAGTAAVTAASGAVALLGKQAVESYADFEQLAGGVETLFGDAAQTVMDNAAQAFKTAGMSVNEYMETATASAAAMVNSLAGDTKQAAKLTDMAVTDMSDNINKMGSSAESVQNAYAGFAKGNFTMLDNLKLGYGGTKQEMERLLETAEKLTGAKYSIDSYADIVQAIHAIQVEMGVAGTTAKEASETISGSVGMVKAAWSNLLVGVADDTQDFDKLTDDLVTSVDAAAKNILPRAEVALGGVVRLVDGLSDDAVRLITDLAGYAPMAVDAGLSLMDAFASGIREHLPELLDTGLTLGLELLSGVGDLTVNFLDIGAELAGQLSTGITDNLPRITGTAREVTLRIIKALGESLPDILTAGAEITEMLVNSLSGDMSRFTTFGNMLIRALTNAVSDTAPDLLRMVFTLLESLGGSMLDSLPVLLGCAVQLIDTVVKTIADPKDIAALAGAAVLIVETLGGALLGNVQPLLDAAATLINALIAAFAQPDALMQLLEAGLSIITSLVDILVQNVEPLTDAALQIITVLGTALLSSVPVLLEAAVSVLQMLIEGLSDPEALTGLLNTGLVILTTLADILMQNLEPLLGAVIAIIAALGSWLGEHALDLVGAGLSIVQAVVDAVIQNLPLLLDAAVQIIEGLCKGIEEDSDDVLISIEQIIRSLLGFLLSPDTIRMISKAGGRIIRALIPAAKELAADLLGFAWDLLDEWGEAILAPDWGEIGRNIVNGIIEGIIGVDFDEQLFKSDFADNWVSGFKDIFGIHSPSKLMEDEIGKNLALGIEVGFDENLPDPGDALEAFNDIAVEMPSVSVPVAWETQPLPDPDEITVSLTDDAVRVLEALRGTQIPVRTETDTAALEALRTSPLPDASALVPQSATSVVNNSYYSTVNTTTSNQTTNNNTAENHAASGNIVIPVQIGEEKIETIVLSAIELANARSGGGTI